MAVETRVARGLRRVAGRATLLMVDRREIGVKFTRIRFERRHARPFRPGIFGWEKLGILLVLCELMAVVTVHRMHVAAVTEFR